jgi:hypothetical protein
MTNRREFLQTTATIAGSLVPQKQFLPHLHRLFISFMQIPANTGMSLPPFNGRFKTPMNRSWLLPPKGYRS